MFFQVSILIISIFMLWFGAKYLVESSERVANLFGVSELVIGLTVVALGTSAPEFAVSITAALTSHSNISVGNIVGSNIFNLGFILGTVAIIQTIKTTPKLVYRDGLFMISTTIILLFFFFDHTLSKIEGIILIILLIAYLLFLFIKKEKLEDEEIEKTKATFKDFFILPLSIAVIVFGGKYLVSSASEIARFLGMSEWLIAITIVAAGTSAPEMVTSLAAVLKGKHGMSAGNLVGSNIFNILGVLGAAGTINNLKISSSGFNSLVLLTIMIIVVIFLMRARWKLSKLEGIIILAMGISLWVYGFII